MTQAEAVALMESGASVLLTGAAGTGKTFTLNVFIKRAQAQGKSVAVTATTGLAATHLSGSTIHAWSGLGVADDLTPDMLMRVPKSRSDIIAKADILVIDEISMLHDFRLDMVDQMARAVRESDQPFGGIQVVLCGDFFQLPPINRNDSRQGGFVTKSEIWADNHFEVAYLKKQYRQADDQEYTDLLNGIRAGKLQKVQLQSLLDKKTDVFDPWANHTKLLTTNVDVDKINAQHLQELDGEERSYEAALTGSARYKEQLTRSCLAMPELNLKIGAKVMFIRNSTDKKYVNGTLGEVVGFDGLTDYPIVQISGTKKEVTAAPETWELNDGDKTRASLSQIPLRLAWAITVHKSQGMTLDGAMVDLSKAFTPGMGYVALSRVKNLDGLTLAGINRMALQVSPDAQKIDVDLRSRSDQALADHSEHVKDWINDHGQTIKMPKKTSKKAPAGTWASKLENMRADHPNAFKRWQANEDKVLEKLSKDGALISQMSEQLGRHEGSIRARLEKLELAVE